MTAIIEEDPNFKKILSYLLKVKGFDGRRYKLNYIKRRVAVRMRATGTANYQEYLHFLQANPPESSFLLDRLTIHVTEFFRDPEVYQAIQKPRALRWFQQEENKVIVSTELKRAIHFRTHDLLGKWSPVMSGFHLILCRNLLIYLTAVQQQSLYARFAEALVPGGYLVLGQTETLLGAARQLYRCVDVHHRIYQTLSQEEKSRP
jgi:chemotaxis methyl-accepting protein methylase